MLLSLPKVTHLATELGLEPSESLLILLICSHVPCTTEEKI